MCFNPRPSRRKGATAGGVDIQNDLSVSILALPEGRALLGASLRGEAARSFQSSPFPKEGRYAQELQP
ncbi:MAG: hypothetical protein OJF47_004076 [Nitrospira sp.]|nr:MAG: hypothetical protein OJF47_004076 [Nitrospira sp.]